MSGDCNEVDRKRLKNWERWLEEWEKVQKKVAEKLKTFPSNLLLNYSIKINYVNQEKLLLEARTPTYFDKYRGKPSWYNVPEALPLRNKCDITEPVYFMVETKKQKLEVPSLECVGLPNFIVQNEKNIIHETRNIYKRWQSSAYRQQQIEKLSPKMKNIFPQWSNFEHLIVLGQKMSKEENIEQCDSVFNELPSIDITEENSISAQIVAISKKPRLSLQINKIVFDTSFSVENKKIHIYFDYDIYADLIAIEYMDIENLGCSTLRISFSKLENHQLFRQYISKSNDNSGFFFNRNELLLLPGEKQQFPIWFQTKNSGFYKENWIISTKPRIWREQFKVVLFLQSYAYYKDIKKSIEKIQSYINWQARNILIENSLSTVFEEINSKDTPAEPCQFNEKHLFEATNMVNNRPLFLYDKQVIDNLKIFHAKISNENQWNYSINVLRELAYKNDIENYLQGKITEREKVLNEMEKNVRNTIIENIIDSGKTLAPDSKSFSQNKYKKDKTTKKTNKRDKKNKETNSVLKQDTNFKKDKSKSFVYSCESELDNFLSQLYSPLVVNTEREKYLAATQVFSAYFSKMGSLLLKLKEENNIYVTKSYPLYKHKFTTLDKYPCRLIFENYSCEYLPPRQEETMNYNDTKNTSKLKNLSENSIEFFHHSTNIITPKGEKKDKKSNKFSTANTSTKPKRNKTKSKEKISNSMMTKFEIPLENVDLFIEEFEYSSEIEILEHENNSESNLKIIVPQDPENYSLQQYIIVYSCLKDAVDALLSTLDSVKCSAFCFPSAEINKSSMSQVFKKH